MNKVALPIIAALLASAASHAQQTAVNANSPTMGLLGTSYAEVNGSLENIEHASREGYNIGIFDNMPVASQVDARFGYNYWWYNNGAGRSHYHLVTGELRYYLPMSTVKPFVGGLLGYEWWRSDFGGNVSSTTTTGTTTNDSSAYGGGGTTTTTSTSTAYYGSTSKRDNFGIWAVTGGVEVPLAGFTVTPHISYGNRFNSGGHAAYRYGAELHHWFSDTLGGYADVTYNDIGHEPNAWAYTIGVRLRY